MSLPISAANKETYDQIRREGIFRQTTPDEIQEQGGLTVNQLIKGRLTRASIYEREFPDKITQALCIDGPKDSDGAMTFHGDGAITLMTGVRDPNRGAGSGKLNIKAYGGQQTYMDRVDLEFNFGTDSEEKRGLSVACYGDYIEETVGSERHIIAKTIRIEATEEIVIAGGSIKLQSQSDIELAGTSINSASINEKNIILGQQMTFGVSEKTDISFDPRANQTILSPGHLNHKILGDYCVNVGGMEEHIIGGVPRPESPLVKDKSKSYSVKTLALPVSIDAATGILLNAGGVITSTAGGAVTTTAGGAVTTTAVGALTLTATLGIFADAGIAGKFEAKGLDFELKSLLGAKVKSAGPIVLLN